MADSAQESWQIQSQASKKEGDDAFKKGDYKDAVKKYTDAIDIDDENREYRTWWVEEMGGSLVIHKQV